MLAKNEDNIHTPIIKEANFTGANLVIIDNPTGDKHNSAIVCKKYVNNNHIKAAFC